MSEFGALPNDSNQTLKKIDKNTENAKNWHFCSYHKNFLTYGYFGQFSGFSTIFNHFASLGNEPNHQFVLFWM